MPGRKASRDGVFLNRLLPSLSRSDEKKAPPLPPPPQPILPFSSASIKARQAQRARLARKSVAERFRDLHGPRWLALLATLSLLFWLWLPSTSSEVGQGERVRVKVGREDKLVAEVADLHEALPKAAARQTHVVTSMSSTKAPVGQASKPAVPKVEIFNVRPVSRAPTLEEGEKYLSYVPHSRFANQRIALHNALVLASALNRTLLLPPARLGECNQWSSRRTLQQTWDAGLKSDEEVKACEHPSPSATTASDQEPVYGTSAFCSKRKIHTLVQWDRFFRFNTIPSLPRLIDRWINTTDLVYGKRSEGGLQLSKADVHTFPNIQRFDITFRDDPNDASPLGPYSESMSLETLSSPPYSDFRLLRFGSMFGTSRLHFTTPDKLNLLQELGIDGTAMTFGNELVDVASSEIRKRLGGGKHYKGVHLRVGDGPFQDNAARNADEAFAYLCVEVLKISPTTVRGLMTQIEREIAEEERSLRERGIRPFYAPPPGVHLERLSCRKPGRSDIPVLNQPIYIASDSPDALTDRSLALFFHTFPCTFVLEDFARRTAYNGHVPAASVQRLEHVVSSYDGTKLGAVLNAFVDALVVAKSAEAVGTPGSTYSDFILALHGEMGGDRS